ncbi:hypothetical protein Asulf_02080 [Archaeoglobus sulfaticallidus PM70-1]|uniref:Uncharacterized protein n=1 Tax=Archaeoglobus sulfaticallidus PM70-1 TaxID=387631 RepID=N0BNY3_9EURY|nr:hypothetical protein [Archaeoglobus sulfaticallidus]AGK62040.1 hypothetical protein Asulf_02080 [Archaeoglobus sulfaticallidus PM70-1]
MQQISKLKLYLMLKLAGFRVRKLFTPYGEIFIAKRAGNSICVATGNTIPLAEIKIEFRPQKRNIILTNSEGMSKYETMNLEEFISFLTGFKENIDERCKEIVDFDVVDEFIGSYRDQTKAVAILNSALLMYIYGEFPEVYVHTKEFRQRLEIKPDIAMLEELKNLGMAYSHPKERNVPARMNYLTEDGRDLAREFLYRKIDVNRDELNRIVDKIGRKEVFLICCGTIGKSGMSLEVRQPDSDLSVKYGDRYSLIPMLHIRRFDFEKLKEIYTKFQLFSRFMADFVIYDESVRLFSELEKIGLASKVRKFSKLGVEIGEFYKAPLELCEYLMDICYFDVPENVIDSFMNAFASLCLQKSDLAGERRLRELFMAMDEDFDRVSMVENPSIEISELVSRILG